MGDYLGNAVVPRQEGLSTAIVLLLATLLAIVFHCRLVEGWRSAADTLFNSFLRKAVFDNSHIRNSIVISFAITSVLYGTAIALEESSRPLWFVMVVLAVYFILRESVLRLSLWFSGKKKEFDLARIISYSAFSLIFLTALPVVVLSVLEVETIRIFTDIYLGLIFGFFYAIYLKNLYKILISSGFSIFSSILYLCALEMLPALVAIKELTS